MKVWGAGREENVEIGQEVFIGHCGSGMSVFGEKGSLIKVTSQHLVFKTESGIIIKTKKDNLNAVIGKAGKQGIFVSTKLREEDDENYFHSPILVW